jgi:hypothetical protein
MCNDGGEVPGLNGSRIEMMLAGRRRSFESFRL